MASTAGGKGSIIVNTSSTAVRTSALPAMVGGGMYAASKAAAEMLMKYAAIEVSYSLVHKSHILFWLRQDISTSVRHVRE